MPKKLIALINTKGKTQDEIAKEAMKLVRSSKLSAKMDRVSNAFLQAIKDTPRDEQY